MLVFCFPVEDFFFAFLRVRKRVIALGHEAASCPRCLTLPFCSGWSLLWPLGATPRDLLHKDARGGGFLDSRRGIWKPASRLLGSKQAGSQPAALRRVPAPPRGVINRASGNATAVGHAAGAIKREDRGSHTMRSHRICSPFRLHSSRFIEGFRTQSLCCMFFILNTNNNRGIYRTV